MLTSLAYLFAYRLILVAGLMIIWAVMLAIQHTVSKRRWFRLLPFAFAIVMFGSAIYHPLVIASPKSGTVVHPGDSVPVTIEFRPAFLSTLFPFVAINLPECWSCTMPPEGVTAHGVLKGPLYRFTIELPKTTPGRVLVTSATAAMAGGRHPALRSTFIELVVESKQSATGKQGLKR